MRITEKKFIILRYLQWHGRLFDHPDYVRVFRRISGSRVLASKGSPTFKNYVEDDGRPELIDVYRSLNERWPSLSDDYGYRVEMLSSQFCAAVEEAQETLHKDRDTCLAYLAGRTFRGTLLIPHLDSSVSYSLKFNDAGTGCERTDILQLSSGDCISLYTDGSMLFVTDTMHLSDIRTGRQAPAAEQSRMQGVLDYLDTMLGFLTDYICFLKFANVSERFVTGANSRQGRRARPDDDVNETPVPVRQMTVSYFTTTVRTEGFPRRGFFRMQPHKVDGQWRHYLRWIDATYVSGYTRKAQKLVRQEHGEQSRKP